LNVVNGKVVFTESQIRKGKDEKQGKVTLGCSEQEIWEALEKMEPELSSKYWQESMDDYMDLMLRMRKLIRTPDTIDADIYSTNVISKSFFEMAEHLADAEIKEIQRKEPEDSSQRKEKIDSIRGDLIKFQNEMSVFIRANEQNRMSAKLYLDAWRKGREASIGWIDEKKLGHNNKFEVLQAVLVAQLGLYSFTPRHFELELCRSMIMKLNNSAVPIGEQYLDEEFIPFGDHFNLNNYAGQSHTLQRAFEAGSGNTGETSTKGKIDMLVSQNTGRGVISSIRMKKGDETFETIAFRDRIKESFKDRQYVMRTEDDGKEYIATLQLEKLLDNASIKAASEEYKNLFLHDVYTLIYQLQRPDSGFKENDTLKMEQLISQWAGKYDITDKDALTLLRKTLVDEFLIDMYINFRKIGIRYEEKPAAPSSNGP